MSALRKLGDNNGLIGLNALAFTSQDPTALVSGVSAATTGFILDKVQDMREKGQLKDNDMYFLWNLKNSIN